MRSTPTATPIQWMHRLLLQLSLAQFFGCHRMIYWFAVCSLQFFLLKLDCGKCECCIASFIAPTTRPRLSTENVYKNGFGMSSNGSKCHLAFRNLCCACVCVCELFLSTLMCARLINRKVNWIFCVPMVNDIK